jgi:sulfate adenylyltransferase subunit 1
MVNNLDLISIDIEKYLSIHENKDILRFLTCGNVDDGKSTLIGRLLYDSNLIFDDHFSALRKNKDEASTAHENLDLSLLVDGLQAEREQGITIDVAYRYFNTAARKYIIADCPGHEQYTRNMVTGASNCDLAIIMIDARFGIQKQARRHAFICSLLGLKHIVVAINKMDLIDFNEDKFEKIKTDYHFFSQELGFNFIDTRFVPISALLGDNIVNASENMAWYLGLTLMAMLETTKVYSDKNFEDFRFPVQFVNRPNLNFRGYCGTIASGVVRTGDELIILPSYKRSCVKKIITYDGECEAAFPDEAITIVLEDEVDISRGDMLVKSDSVPIQGNQFLADIIWLAEAALCLKKEYYIKLFTKTTTGIVSHINYEIDLETLDHKISTQFDLNSIGNATVILNESIPLDNYKDNPKTGAFIIIDRLSNNTVGAGVISGFEKSKDLDKNKNKNKNYSAFEKSLNALICRDFPEWKCRQI